ncbi:MAG: methionine ABC transporter permease [Lachnospirales bacterium]
MPEDYIESVIYYLQKLIIPATFVTIRMVIAIVLIGTLLGFGLAILMTMYGPMGLNPKKKIYNVINFFVNTIRSFPILILIVAMGPITRIIVGTTIGEKAVILPLSIAATAFIARLLENSFLEIDKQLIEAARSFGASDFQIIYRVIMKESVPAIISTITLATVNNISGTTIASAIGAGGLGAVALTYGFQSFNETILYISVLILLLLVNITQYIGGIFYKKYL